MFPGICLACQILHMRSYSLFAKFSTPNLKISAGMPSGPPDLWFFICTLDLTRCWHGVSGCCGMDRKVSSVTTVVRFRIDLEQLEVLPPSLLNGSVILQKCPILGLQRISSVVI